MTATDLEPDSITTIKWSGHYIGIVTNWGSLKPIETFEELKPFIVEKVGGMKNFTWHKHFAFWPVTIGGKRIWFRTFWRRKRFGAAHLWELAMQRGREYSYFYEEKKHGSENTARY